MANRVDREKRDQRLRALGMNGRLPTALTERVVDAVRTHPTGERFMLADGKVPGLALAVYPDGAASYVLQVRTQAGVARRCGLGSAASVTLEAARDEAERLRAVVKAGGDPTAERRAARLEAQSAQKSTVRAYLEDVYEPKKLKQRKGKNGAIAKAHILATWEPLLDLQLAAVTRDAIEKVLADRKAATKPDGSRKIKDGTLLRDWNPLRAMLADAVDRGYLAGMPVTRRPEPIRGMQDEPRIRWLGENDTDEDLAKGTGERGRFFKALDAFESDEPGGGDFLRCAVRLAVNTGMRRGELVRLRDEMIKRSPDRLELPGAICKSGKAGKVFLNPDALAAVTRWLEVRKTLKLQSIRGELFPGEGKPEDAAERWEDRITQREFPRLCEEAGVSGLTFHSLRHTFAALLVKAGVPLIEVRSACRHASIVTTEKHYAHLAPTAVQKSVQSLRVL